jgi:hypothetical protein
MFVLRGDYKKERTLPDVVVSEGAKASAKKCLITREVPAALHERDIMSGYLRFQSEGLMTQWGSPETFTAEGVHVFEDALSDVDEEKTALELSDGSTVHVIIANNSGAALPLNTGLRLLKRSVPA